MQASLSVESSRLAFFAISAARQAFEAADLVRETARAVRLPASGEPKKDTQQI